MELKQKGASAQIGSFKQLKVSLIWTSAVDLDLVAFYKTKDGRVGGVYSDNYAGGSMGDLNAFPFMQLSEDAGVGAVGGDNREDMLIAKLDDLEELWICALNFTDASQKTNKVFANYDARVEVMTDRGESHTVDLASQAQGSVAVICKFTAGFMGAQLVNDSEVMAFEQFQASVPGANAIKLASKISLAGKGDSHTMQLKQKGAGDEIVINLNWNAHPGGQKKKGFFGALLGGGGGEIDLDLGCFFELRNHPVRSVIDGLQFAHDKSRQGNLNGPPWIYHMGDDRTGSQSASGEFIKVNPSNLGEIKRMTIYCFIYEGAARWAETDAVVSIKVPGQPEVEVQMGKQSDSRKFCAIAGLDFVGDSGIKVTRYVTFHNDHGECDRAYGWGLKWGAGRK